MTTRRIALKRNAIVSAFLLLVSAVVCCWASSKDEDDGPNSFKNYCAEAQKVIANAPNVDARINHYEDLGNFIDSDAEPYGRNQSNSTLEVSQFVGLSSSSTLSLSSEPQESPAAATTTVLCKMKSADALDKYFGIGTSITGEDNPCSAINKQIVKSVIKKMQQKNENGKEEHDWELSRTFQSIIYDDWITKTGSQWSGNSPAVTAYQDADSVLHLVGKSLYVSVKNRWFPLRSKVGVHYCQTITAEYVKALLLNQVDAPFCGSPPSYRFFWSKKAWDCPPASSGINVAPARFDRGWPLANHIMVPS